MWKTFEGAGIGPLVVHTPYFVAPASHKEEVGGLATRMIVEDVRRARELGARYVVVHAGHYQPGSGAGGGGVGSAVRAKGGAGAEAGAGAGVAWPGGGAEAYGGIGAGSGSRGGSGPEMVACRVGAALRELAEEGFGDGGGGVGGSGGSGGSTGGSRGSGRGAGEGPDVAGRVGSGQGGEPLVLVENGAGSKGDASGTLERWAMCLHLLRAEGLPIGGCLDTAHLWGSGWDLAAGDGEAGVELLIQELSKLDLLGLIKVLHLNDSSAERASGKDRHEHIEDGVIPAGAFRRLLREPAFAGLPGIVESSPDDGKLARDMVVLKRLRDGDG